MMAGALGTPPNKRMQPTSLAVTVSARGLASLAAHPAPPLTLAADTHPVGRTAGIGDSYKWSLCRGRWPDS